MSGGHAGNQLNASCGGELQVTGGTWGGSARVFQDGNITFFGNFNFPYGAYGIISGIDDAVLTGTLADGSPVSNLLEFSSTGTMTLSPVPEPSSMAYSRLPR
ncbi:MAG: hypothetical protein H6819_01180 [Phycisphaerales bacterium]|nr:hypothetical protein [Phycisphaerales bacterium]MCB9857179.1 hypothetical protein [Phycisphaerales bacterium]MCB9863108.1 hypothetical protein [Phycisphaerales bacterium]